MSEHARNQDTFMDGDDGPEYIPVVGDRVSLYFEDEPPAPGDPEQIGTVVEVKQWHDGDLRFVVMLDKTFQKHYHWRLQVTLDEIDTVYS